LPKLYEEELIERDAIVATYLEYVRAAMRHAQYEQMEDRTWYASIPGLKGLWATGQTKDDATNELFSALDGWLYINAHVGKQPLPEFDGISPLHRPQKSE
jgi:predicted RNase H-like HicB family nuclease